MTHTVESLLAFSARVKAAFLEKRIRSPVHLCSSTQAQPLIDIFRDIRPQDYVFGTWRNCFHALLKGIPEEEVFQQILDGRSMFVMSAEHRFLSGSIVGGMLPIAAGVAAGVKRKGEDARVWVFVGDMAATGGLFHEFRKYAAGHGLPVWIVVENNGMSTDTPTSEAWGTESFSGYTEVEIKYDYDRTTAHCGVGEFVQF